MTELDLRGLRCPLPALKTQKRLDAMRPGERLAVLSDDPLAAIDIAHHCRQAGHLLLASTVCVDHRRFEIEHGGSAAE